MNDYLTLEKINNNLINNNITKLEAINLLISLIEGSEDANVRAKCIEGLTQLELNNAKVFKTLESCLISDENPLVRAKAAEIIMLNFLEKGFSPLKWAIQNDNSYLVLKTLNRLIDGIRNHTMERLREEFFKRLEDISSTFKLVPKEALIILDLGIDLNKVGSNGQYYFIFGNNASCVIKNRHVQALSFSLKTNLSYSVSSLSKLKNLDLSCNYFTILPDLFNFLSHLEHLDLSWNDFSSFPKQLNKLKNQKILSLKMSHNDINIIPEWIGTLKSLKYLDLSYNTIKNIPESIGLLNSLEELNLQGNNLQEIPPSLGLLISLKRLRLSNNNIREIPDSMGSLALLQDLDLKNNNIQELPESMRELNSLISLNLKGNGIQRLQESMSSLEKLKL